MSSIHNKMILKSMALPVEFGERMRVFLANVLPPSNYLREAACVMRAYLQPHSSIQFDPSCSLYEARNGAVIELGAGTGYLGLALARYISLSSQKSRSAKTLVLTDLPDVCSLLERNRSRKIPISFPDINIVIEPLSWGHLRNGENIANKLSGIHSSPLLSHIIGSDLVTKYSLFFLQRSSQ